MFTRPMHSEPSMAAAVGSGHTGFFRHRRLGVSSSLSLEGTQALDHDRRDRHGPIDVRLGVAFTEREPDAGVGILGPKPQGDEHVRRSG